MWSKEVTIKTNATREQVWTLWSDVENWHKWDNDIEFAKLNGKFEEGVCGILKPCQAPKSKFELITVDKFNEFTTRAFLPLTKIDFIHKITEKEGGIYITHAVQITGLLTFLFSKIIGEKIIKGLPNTMNNLSEMAEKVSNE
ncbi:MULTISPECIES: SRPBCC family protein [Pasteurellaceae]|uniref:SRPBCC family protein n=1 Tax=Pasteurella atlantica TaxID=2827233 RepID=A0AAW8CML4_9PAST|nr:SRPBCC family protein [Pasteurella atlantica]MBR0572646.1 SRPBCC family protein [Pasteurella atlantica]MDP8038592.1 SRPBCC family protein [Pasteurella atlantica]MDP8040684.1 SRPBCC family protein [Pasteurella atlantica]MDP8042819.1 SRPBCC family protein [Pasteurella atlantica]MDP8044906.1 SRPBCC family protein [Pasteurella atlantica]